jgi:D-sedoheptulose 7-phosphate isomerase
MIDEKVLTKDEQVMLRLVDEHFAASMTTAETFFAAQADRISDACWAMARRFHEGGKLIAFGNGASASDAQHVSVEFVHPVIMGKRALPAIGIPLDRPLILLGRTPDIALGFSFGGRDTSVNSALTTARQMGMLTLALTGADGGGIGPDAVDYHFAVPSDDALIVQETHETLYHILWELVHIFFEHEGLLT